MSVLQMITSSPVVPSLEATALAECIEACLACSQTCTACADACCEAACRRLLEALRDAGTPKPEPVGSATDPSTTPPPRR